MHKLLNTSELASDRHIRVAVGIWIAAVLVIGLLVCLTPLKHTVTPVYHEAVTKWLAGKPLYSEYSFHYPPQFIFLFMPFHVLPSPVGDILWRVVSTGLLVWGLWKIISLFQDPQNNRLFLQATLIALAPSLDAMRNGQANVFFGALTALAAASLAASQWWLASLYLLVALAMKGAIGLVMMFLAAIIYRQLIWRLALGLVVFLAFAFLFSDPSYVVSQYQQYLKHLVELSVNDRHFATLNELFRRLGMGLSERTSPLMSIGAGLGVMIVWILGAAKRQEPERAVLLLGLTTTYLMLFNPMTEKNSYIIVAPILALYSVRAMQIKESAKLGYCVAFLAVSLGLFPEMFRGIDKEFGMWWGPLVMLVFGTILIYSLFRKERGNPKFCS